MCWCLFVEGKEKGKGGEKSADVIFEDGIRVEGYKYRDSNRYKVNDEDLPLRGVLHERRIYPFTWIFLCAAQMAWQA